jgi:hypothetical protein
MMKFKKEIINHLDNCYACAQMKINGKNHFLVASEERKSCHIIDEETGKITSVWDNIGGTMSIVPLKGKGEQFLASQRFYPGFNARESTIVWAYLKDEKWEVKTLFTLPYIHRFDELQSDNGKKYFIGCTLCETKGGIDDWSSGGHIMVGILPDNLEEPFELESIQGNLVKNHGYYRTKVNGQDASIVTCESGGYLVSPPSTTNDKWSVKQIFDWPISDLALVDIDGDGEEEVATIEPFHGNLFCIYKRENEVYKKVYEYPKKMEFGHVVWGGMLSGVPTIVGGYRALSKELFYIQYSNGQYKTVTIDEGVGPCNIFVVHHEEEDVIVATNGAVNEIAKYTVNK